ncbi:hypothetical protein PGT21_025643 [Puccinia graminis f. sp. tritici]|uniref:Uncharacterized protein n=1 Tax=Puccinia graminis f. sp. tritici TaxID=56615 RepID=A0A5B0MS67_PUCGR|nr:hypothetical protein PGT21_025643 [Puccinia graminis f. sp. tritici]
MLALRSPGRHRLLCFSLLCSNIAVKATTPENLNSFRWDGPAKSDYTTDDLFAALSPNHAPGVTPPEELVWAELLEQPPSRSKVGDPKSPVIPSDFIAHSARTFSPELLPPGGLVASPPSSHLHRSTEQVGGINHSINPSVVQLDETRSLSSPVTPGHQPVVDESSDVETSAHRSINRMQRLTELAILIQKYQSRPSHRTCLSPSGEILIPYLKNQKIGFEGKLKTVDFGKLDFKGIASLDKTIHPALPYARYKRGDQSELLRVLRRTTQELQKDSRLILNYRNLIIFMQKIYEEFLDNLRIPTVAQVQYQQEMLDWLDREIFGPTIGHPVLGFIEPPYPIWTADPLDKTTGANQVLLIEYFSQREHDLDILPATSFKLLKKFQREGE